MNTELNLVGSNFNVGIKQSSQLDSLVHTKEWNSLADWANYTDSDEWRTLEEEARGFITNIQVEIWGPSPIVPESLRPSS